MAEEMKWYVAHTYSGYENTVAVSIEQAVENRNMHDVIAEVSIPMETVTEITDNGPKTVERKVFPGYVLVKMVMTDETWHLVRNIRGVTGFVGSANKAIPLTDEEIAALGVEKREVMVSYAVGDNVKITDGALESFIGTVEEIDTERSKVPEQFGLGRAPLEELRGGDGVCNAEITRRILSGKERGAKRDVVLLNAGAVLYIGGVAESIEAGVKLAAETIDAGAAMNKLQQLVAASNQ